MKRVLLALLLLATIAGCKKEEPTVLAPQNGEAQPEAVLDGKIVPRKEYEQALPKINGSSVNIRRYPLTGSEVLCTVDLGQRVEVSGKTRERDIIGNEQWPWYQVVIRERNKDAVTGWVYGKYITFQKEHQEEFWKLWDISVFAFKRQIFVDNFIEKRFGSNVTDKGYSTDVLKQYRLIAREKAELWYFGEFGFTKNSYDTDFGYLQAYVNDEKKVWDDESIEITKPIPECEIKIGMTLEEFKEKFGRDYITEENKIIYGWSMIGGIKNTITIKVENDVVTMIQITKFRS